MRTNTKYIDIYTQIKYDIESGKYPINEKLPQGRILADQFDVSELTITKAINLLVQEGYIVRRRGSGSFVKNFRNSTITKFSPLTGSTALHEGEVTSTIIGFSTGGENGATKKEVEGTITTDPVSGEQVVEDSKQSQTSAGVPISDRPTMLGFGKLTDYGVSVDQRAKISEQLTAFSKTTDPKITRFSFYKDSYRQQVPDENGVSHITFDVQANQKNDYYVDVAYSGTSDARVSIYKDDKTTLLFTE